MYEILWYYIGNTIQDVPFRKYYLGLTVRCKKKGYVALPESLIQGYDVMWR
jgi:hypothetical protein